MQKGVSHKLLFDLTARSASKSIFSWAFSPSSLTGLSEIWATINEEFESKSWAILDLELDYWHESNPV